MINILRRNQKIWEYIKYNMVGTSNFILSQIFYICLCLIFNINYMVAYTVTSILSVTASYLLNSKITFSQDNYCAIKFSKTILIYGVEYFINFSVILILVEIIGISSVISPIIAPVFSTIPVFLMMRSVLKKQKKLKHV